MTLFILISTCLVSVLCFYNQSLFYKLDFQPYEIQRNPIKEFHRFLTHGFIHADWMHLLFNMLSFYFFAGAVETVFQVKFPDHAMTYFLLLYIGGIFMSVIHTYEKHKNDIHYHGVGASGGVSAVMMASVIYFPLNEICLYGILCFPGIIWAIIYLGYSFFMGRRGGDYINHDAHFIGAVYGVAITLILDRHALSEFISQLAH
jgi:membrane associated rhomboid family serine protease